MTTPQLTDEQIDAVCAPGRAERWKGDGRQYDRDTARLIERAILAAVIATHTAKVLEDVEPFVFEEYPYHCEAMGCGLEDRNITDRYEAMAYGWERAMERAAEAIPDDLYPAHTVAALKSRVDALAARVAELEKDAGPEEFTRGIDAAAKMLDKMADDYSNNHAVQDPDTGVYEFGRGGKEDYYNTLRELADGIRSIVYAPGERENTAQTLKAAKDAAFEQAANLLECEYAEDAKQKRRLDQIAQHIRDLKKGSL